MRKPVVPLYGFRPNCPSTEGPTEVPAALPPEKGRGAIPPRKSRLLREPMEACACRSTEFYTLLDGLRQVPRQGEKYRQGHSGSAEPDGPNPTP